MVTDIQGSTRAIENGCYKDVNNIGVASIISVVNALKPLSIPYVFGGDGASLCIPAAYVSQVEEALVATQRMAEEQFGLSMRIGIVPYADVRQSRYKVLVGKYQAAPHYEQAMFTGDGMAYAESLVKSDERAENRIRNDNHVTGADFTGFECRWKDIPSPHGETLSLLVTAQSSNRQEAHTLYLDVLEAINRIYGEIANWCPIQQQYMQLSSNLLKLGNEIRIRTSSYSFGKKIKYALKLPLINLIGRYLMENNKVTDSTRWGDYKSTLIKHTDYRKFDDMLRMIISGTTEKTDRIPGTACKKGSARLRHPHIALGTDYLHDFRLQCTARTLYRWLRWRIRDGCQATEKTAA